MREALLQKVFGGKAAHGHQDGNYRDGDHNTVENSDFRNGPKVVWSHGSFKCIATFVAHG